MDKKLFLMVGIPGSGKSTFIKKFITELDGYTAVVSRDEIRFSLLKDGEEYFSRETEVFNKFIDEIKYFLKEDISNVVVDATHISPASRNKVLRALGTLSDVEVNAVVLMTPLDVCLERNSHRTGRAYVPPSAIENMYNGFSVPSINEGFDNIIKIR